MNQYYRYRLKKRARFVFILFFILTLLVGGGLWASGLLHEALYHVGLADVPEKPDAFKGRLNVLVMGMDTRKGESVARADTIMLCSVDTEKNIMSILSIPRDTRVKIPGHGWEKINSATVFGGPSLAMKVVSDLLGIRVDNYVMTDYEGFKEIVDSLGGVTIDIKERMYHHDPEDGGIYTIDLKPGVQRLNGEKALQYVRFRGYALGDIGRAETQQKFLSALIKEVLQPSTVVKLPSLMVSTYKAVDTNLSLLNMKKLAVTASKMTNANLLTQTLPGKFLEVDGASYWEHDPYLTGQVMAGIYEGRVTVGKAVQGETTIVTTDTPGQEDEKNQGKVVPGEPGQSGGVRDSKPGAAGTTPKTGTTGQTTGTGGKTGTEKKPGSGTNGGSTGVKTGQSGSSQSPGAIIPPSQQGEKKDPPVTVIIVPKTTTN